MKPTQSIGFRTLVKLLTALQRLERLAQQNGQGYLSHQELLLLQAQIARLRTDIPSDVLDCYETVKRSDPELFADPQLFPLAVLLTTIAGWAEQRPRQSASRNYPVRMRFRVSRIARPRLRRDAKCSLLQRRRNI